MSLTPGQGIKIPQDAGLLSQLSLHTTRKTQLNQINIFKKILQSSRACRPYFLSVCFTKRYCFKKYSLSESFSRFSLFRTIRVFNILMRFVILQNGNSLRMSSFLKCTFYTPFIEIKIFLESACTFAV